MATNDGDDVSSAEGIAYKAKMALGSMARQRPSLGRLLENRNQRFTEAHAIVPSDAVAGDPVALTLQVWDQCERLIDDFRGTFRVDSTDGDAIYPDHVTFPARNGGLTTIDAIVFETPGIQYLTFTHEGTGERFVSNPVRVTEDEPDRRLFWGDLHLHSQFSDGCGTPEQGLRFGRDVMDLDVVAYADHDTMGFFIPPRLQRRRMERRYFPRMKEIVREFTDEGEFLPLLGYEWTQQPTVGGHINVYFDCVEEADLFDSISPESDTYEKLFARLREFNERGEGRAVAAPHHSAESSYPFDFAATEYDDEVAPLAEVYSQWGNSERPAWEGNDHPIEMGHGEAERPGHHVQDALALGNRVGLMASADYHDARPGHSLLHADAHLPSLSEWREKGIGWGLIWRIWNEPSYPGGLAGIHATELSRETIFESLRNRQVYGTSQPHRIRVEFAVNGTRVADPDSTVTVDSPTAEREVSVAVAGTGPVERLTVVKNNEDWRRFEGTDDSDADLDAYTVEESWTDDEPITGMAFDDERGIDADTYYVRLAQADGGLAWAGPLWVEVA
ncbi:DUF3604 domain-containing protein [Halorhabdus amylolytica]|uniref:DUF3604 domain-containing protein n=1 Tax=Halorhabdus amylolytica TaxID=2559573 RepID=UPI0010AA1ED8|nr:DUF3604 domain-containing protein [Halorhabdus amylolytica]